MKNSPDTWEQVLVKAISTKRRAHTSGEHKFVAWLCSLATPTMIDGAGNLHYDRRTLAKHKTLFVAHTDTISRGSGEVNGWVRDGDFIRATDDTLGADDGVGVAILMQLLLNDVPGYYIFTREEEAGGKGAKYLAQRHVDLLKQFDRAIAFDRRDTWSVITKQSRGRCCSDDFGDALALELSAFGCLYGTDDTGVYTDTAEFIGYIPECTNLSAGYYQEHGKEEHLLVTHVEALAAAVLQVDWDGLPTVRKAEIIRPVYELPTYHNYGNYGKGKGKSKGKSMFVTDHESYAFGLYPVEEVKEVEEVSTLENLCTREYLDEAIVDFEAGNRRKFQELLAKILPECQGCVAETVGGMFKSDHKAVKYVLDREGVGMALEELWFVAFGEELEDSKAMLRASALLTDS